VTDTCSNTDSSACSHGFSACFPVPKAWPVILDSIDVNIVFHTHIPKGALRGNLWQAFCMCVKLYVTSHRHLKETERV
jgi:hypothetical protein